MENGISKKVLDICITTKNISAKVLVTYGKTKTLKILQTELQVYQSYNIKVKQLPLQCSKFSNVYNVIEMFR